MIDQGPPTDEERQLTAGMPPHIAAGFIAARRGGDVRGMYAQEKRLADLSDQLQDIIREKFRSAR